MMSILERAIAQSLENKELNKVGAPARMLNRKRFGKGILLANFKLESEGYSTYYISNPEM